MHGKLELQSAVCMYVCVLVSPGGSSDGGGAARAKRGRGAGEVHAVADPENNAVIFTTASKCLCVLQALTQCTQRHSSHAATAWSGRTNSLQQTGLHVLNQCSSACCSMRLLL